MLTPLRQIGNSRGILIPAAFLTSCQISDTVDMQLDGERIILRPAPPAARMPRQGWFDAVDLAAEQDLSAEMADWDAVSLGTEADSDAVPESEAQSWVW